MEELLQGFGVLLGIIGAVMAVDAMFCLLKRRMKG